MRLPSFGGEACVCVFSRCYLVSFLEWFPHPPPQTLVQDCSLQRLPKSLSKPYLSSHADSNTKMSNDAAHDQTRVHTMTHIQTPSRVNTLPSKKGRRTGVSPLNIF